ncbi:MAG: hydroxyacylglutathione hydrolase [Buchnera aphidicola (Tetraneura akinire)]
MKKINLVSIPILVDNYVWILINSFNNQCIIIDPGDHIPVINTIYKLNLIPKYILITHNHLDHIMGIEKIVKVFPKIKIFGPKETETHGVKNIVRGEEVIFLLKQKFHVLSTPGHTNGHVSYYFDNYLFCGDTIFSGGCGRIYKKNYIAMFESIKKISNLPDETILCYSHEYTFCNLKFLNINFPNEKEIKNYFNLIKFLKKKNITLISNLRQERKINLFLQLSKNRKFFKNFVKLRKKKDKFICI